jgi:hypothetical protein
MRIEKERMMELIEKAATQYAVNDSDEHPNNHRTEFELKLIKRAYINGIKSSVAMLYHTSTLTDEA